MAPPTQTGTPVTPAVQAPDNRFQWGCTLIACSICVFVLNWCKQKVDEAVQADDAHTQGVYAAGAAFLVILVWGILSNIVWAKPADATGAAQISQSDADDDKVADGFSSNKKKSRRRA